MFSFTVSGDKRQSWWGRRTLLELRLLILLLIILIIAVAMVIVAAATSVALAKSREYRRHEWSLARLRLFGLVWLEVAFGRQILNDHFPCLNKHTVEPTPCKINTNYAY